MDELYQPDEWEIGRIRVKAEMSFLPWALECVRSLLGKADLPELDLEMLVMATEEACLNVIQHAYEPGEDGRYEVAVETPPVAMVIAVEDQGMAFNPELLLQDDSWRTTANQHGLGSHLMRAAVDETRVINRGGRGKRIELLKMRPAADVTEYLQEGDAPGELTEQEAFPKDMSYRFGLMKPDEEEARKLSRWVYRACGYTFLSDVLYYPQRFFNLLQSGMMISCVGMTEKGVPVSHLCLQRHKKANKIAQVREAIVDPRARNKGLFKFMKQHLAAWAKRNGLYGLYANAPTDLPYVQMGEISLGARETGVQLSYLPAALPLRQKDGIRPVGVMGAPRQCVVLFYQSVSPAPERMVFAPERHQRILRLIYEQNNLPRRFVSPREHPKALTDFSELEIRDKEEWKESRILVHEIGRDFTTIVRQHVTNCLKKNINCILAELPLSYSLTPAAAEVLERLGFFFAGIVPEVAEGDVLRLQYVHDSSFDPNSATLVSDLGKKLYAYVLEDRNRAGSMENRIRAASPAPGTY